MPDPNDLRADLEDAAEKLGERVGAIAEDPRVVALDTGVGKWVGRAKALLWLIGATVFGLVGWAAWVALSGNPAYVTSAGAGLVVLFALWRAWRNLTKPIRASEVISDELQARVPVAGLAGRAAQLLGVGRKS